MHFINSMDEKMVYTSSLIPDISFHPGSTYRPSPKPIRCNMPRSQGSLQSLCSPENTSSDINLDFEENSPFQEGVMSKTYQRPDKAFFQKP